MTQLKLRNSLIQLHSGSSDRLVFIQPRKKALSKVLLPIILVVLVASGPLASCDRDFQDNSYSYPASDGSYSFLGQQQINIDQPGFGERPTGLASGRPTRPDFSSFGLRPTTTSTTTEQPIQIQEQLQQQNDDSDSQQQQFGSDRPNSQDSNGQQIVQQNNLTGTEEDDVPTAPIAPNQGFSNQNSRPTTSSGQQQSGSGSSSSRPSRPVISQTTEPSAQLVQQDEVDGSSQNDESTGAQNENDAQQEQVSDNEEQSGGSSQPTPTRAPSTAGGLSRPTAGSGLGGFGRPTGSRPTTTGSQLEELQQVVNGGDIQQQSDEGQDGQVNNEETSGNSNESEEQQVESTTTRRPALRPTSSRRPTSFTTTTTTSTPLSQEGEGQSFENGSSADSNQQQQDGQEQEQQEQDEQPAAPSSTTSTSTTTQVPSTSRAPVVTQQVKSTQQASSRLRANQLSSKVSSRPSVNQQQQPRQQTQRLPSLTKTQANGSRQQQLNLSLGTGASKQNPRRPQSSGFNQGQKPILGGQQGINQQTIGQKPTSGSGTLSQIQQQSEDTDQQQQIPLNMGNSGFNSGRPSSNNDLQQIVQQNNLTGNEDDSEDNQTSNGNTGAGSGSASSAGSGPSSQPGASGLANQQNGSGAASRPNSFRPARPSAQVSTSTTTEQTAQQVQQNEDDSSSSTINGDNNDGSSSSSGINGDNDSVIAQQQQEQQNENEENTSQAQSTRAPLLPGSRPNGQISSSGASGNGVNSAFGRPTSRPTFTSFTTSNPQSDELQQIANGGDAQQQSEENQGASQTGSDESNGSEEQQVESTTTRRPALRPTSSRRPTSFTTTTTTSTPLSQEGEGQSFENGSSADSNQQQQDGQEQEQQEQDEQPAAPSSTTSTSTTTQVPSTSRAPVVAQQVKSAQQASSRLRANPAVVKGRPVATPMVIAQQQQRQNVAQLGNSAPGIKSNAGSPARQQQLPTLTFVPGKGSRRPQSAFGAPAPAPSNLPTVQAPFSALSQQVQVIPAGLDQVNDDFAQTNQAGPVDAPQFIMVPMPAQQQVFEVPQEVVAPAANLFPSANRGNLLQQQIISGPVAEPTFQSRPPKPIISTSQPQSTSTKTVSKTPGSSAANQRATTAATKQGARQLTWMGNLLSGGSSAGKPATQSSSSQAQLSGQTNQGLSGGQSQAQTSQSSGSVKSTKVQSASTVATQSSGARAGVKSQQQANQAVSSSSQTPIPSLARGSVKSNAEQTAPRAPQAQPTGARELGKANNSPQTNLRLVQQPINAGAQKSAARAATATKTSRPAGSESQQASGLSGPRQVLAAQQLTSSSRPAQAGPTKTSNQQVRPNLGLGSTSTSSGTLSGLNSGTNSAQQQQARPTATKTAANQSSGPRFQAILSNNAENAQPASQTNEAVTSENNGSFNGSATIGETNQRQPASSGFSSPSSAAATKGGRAGAKPSDGRQSIRMSPGAKSRLATKSLMAQQQQQLLVN